MSDRGFCQPDADEAASIAATKKKLDLDREIEAVKKEYDEKQKLKREKRKSDGKGNGKDTETKAKEDDEDKQDEKVKDEKVCLPFLIFGCIFDTQVQIKELSKSKEESQVELGPRIYHLNK